MYSAPLSHFSVTLSWRAKPFMNAIYPVESNNKCNTWQN